MAAVADNQEKRPFQEETINAYKVAARALDAWMTSSGIHMPADAAADLLDRVRKLRAKAEDEAVNPAGAEALTAKAADPRRAGGGAFLDDAIRQLREAR